MVSRDFSGEEIVAVLRKFGYRRDRTRGDHVTVPFHDRVRLGTLQNIAEQCGANDFRAWCKWIDEHR